MNTFADPAARASVRQRIAGLTPNAPRQWGRMTPHQMVCHLNDAFLMASGERAPKRVDNFASRSLIRFVALHTKIKWPQGAKTVPEADQEQGGTPPGEWQRDTDRLLKLFDAFSPRPDVPHPFFGPLGAEEWNVWAFRHIDHHLRQFGT